MPQHANLRTAGDHGSYCSLDKYKLGLFSWILHFCLHYACADIARACQLFVSVADAEDLLDYFSRPAGHSRRAWDRMHGL